MAADRELSLDKVGDVFFELLSRLDRPAALKIEERRADQQLQETKAELVRVEAELKRVSALADARRGPIEALGRLRRRGVNEVDIACWSRLLSASRISPKPESTEGGRRVSVLKRQEGAPVNLG